MLVCREMTKAKDTNCQSLGCIGPFFENSWHFFWSFKLTNFQVFKEFRIYIHFERYQWTRDLKVDPKKRNFSTLTSILQMDNKNWHLCSLNWNEMGNFILVLLEYISIFVAFMLYGIFCLVLFCVCFVFLYVTVIVHILMLLGRFLCSKYELITHQ